MAEQKLWYLITYDVRDPKRLRRAAKKLKGYGDRLQLSVYRCRLNERGLERLRWELTKILTVDDNLLVVGLCETCVKRIRRKEGEEGWPKDPPGYEIV
jgi:CRISPR-associated protein Cas2